MLKDTQGNRMMLVHMLLLLTHCVPHGTHPRGICTIATILESKVGARTADVVAANVIRRIDPLLELVEGTADTTQGIMTDTRRATNMLYSTCEDVRDEIHKAAEQAKEELWRAT